MTWSLMPRATSWRASGSSPSRAELAPGYSVPRQIVGLWQFSEGHSREPIDRADALRAMEEYFEAGFDTFDCADIYVGVEVLLGDLRDRLGPRAERLQVHTKYVPDRSALATLRRADVVTSVDRSLRRLRTERLDLGQFAWWDYDVPGYVDAVGWLGEQRDAGKIRLVGTTNFDVPRLREMASTGVPLIAHQVQYSLLDRRPERFLRDYTRRAGRRRTLNEVKTSFGYDCVFLRRDERGKALCSVYKARPHQCRTWPYWPENLRSEKAWLRAAQHCEGMRGGKKSKAAIPGGISMGVLGTDQYDAALDFDVGKKYGCLGLGTAGIIVMDEDTNMVSVARNIARFFARESCGQCTPCREGSGWIYKTLCRIEAGDGTTKDLDLLLELAGSMGAMPGTTICGLADGTNWAVRTIINKFRGDFEKLVTQEQYVALNVVG